MDILMFWTKMSFKILRVNHFHITIYLSYKCRWASQVAKMVKNLPAVQETWVWSLGKEDSLEKVMATYPSILARRIPWTEDPGGLQSMGFSKSWTSYTNADTLENWVTFYEKIRGYPMPPFGITRYRILGGNLQQIFQGYCF